VAPGDRALAAEVDDVLGTVLLDHHHVAAARADIDIDGDGPPPARLADQ